MPFVVVFIVIAVVLAILETIGILLSDFVNASMPFFLFLKGNGFLILGITFLILALLVYLYLKPHPAQKHIEAYKKGKISRHAAVERVAASMYNWRKEGIPSAYQSRIMVRRIAALTKRIKAEKTFVDEVIGQIKRNANY